MAKVFVRVGAPASGDAPKPKNKVMVKVKKPDMVALDKDLDANINKYRDEVVNYFNTYIDSPNYKARLLKQGYSEKDADAAIALRKANLGVTGIEKHWTHPDGSHYDTQKQKVIVDPYQFAQYPNFTILGLLGHEYSHVAGSLQYGNPKVPFPMTTSPKEVEEIEKRNKLFKIKMAPENEIDGIIHDRSAQEGKADMDALRYMMYRDKFFDTGTQEFNKDLLKKAKERYSGDFNAARLFKNFSEEDILWMMNNIAKNKGKESNIG
jgi:hypothetical protein